MVCETFFLLQVPRYSRKVAEKKKIGKIAIPNRYALEANVITEKKHEATVNNCLLNKTEVR